MEKRVPKHKISNGDKHLFARVIHDSPLMPYLERIGYRTDLRLLTKGQADMIINYLDKGILPK